MSLPLLHGGITGIRAGSLCRKDAVREALTHALSSCELSREEVASEMTRLTSEAVSVNHIHNWCSGAKREWRFPLEMAAAFCRITGDYGLIEVILEGTNLTLADEKTRKAARLGVLAVQKKKHAQEERELFGEFL